MLVQLVTHPFKKYWKSKIGVKVILTYNVDTVDGFTNGACGERIWIVEDNKGNIYKIVKVKEEANDQEKRKHNP